MSELPNGWQLAHLDELCEWCSGGTPRRSESSYFGGEYPWITISDLNDEVVSSTVECLTETGIANSAAKLVPEGTVLVALYGSIGKLGITKQPSTTNQAIACALPDEQAFEPLYLFHYLRSRRRELSLLGSGVTQKNIYLGDIKTFVIPVAPRAEQTRIVTKLEELLADLDAGVTELKTAQKKLGQYRQSLLKTAVEGTLTAEWRTHHSPTETGAQLLEHILTERRARWEARQLARFAEQGKTPPKDWQKKYPEPVQPDTTDLPQLPEGWGWASVDQLTVEQQYGSSSKTDENPTGVPVLRMGNIQDGDLDFSNLKYLPVGHDEFPGLHLQDGDLLFNRTNSPELVGKTAVYRSQISPCSFASYLICVRFSDGYIPEFASAFINSAHGKRWIKSVVVQQVGQANVNGSKLSALAVPIPPFEEQREIVSVLHAQINEIVDQLKNVNFSLQQSAAQRQNILRAAFSGQLVPQDPNDEPASVLLERIRAERATHSTSKKPHDRQRKERT